MAQKTSICIAYKTPDETNVRFADLRGLSYMYKAGKLFWTKSPQHVGHEQNKTFRLRLKSN